MGVASPSQVAKPLQRLCRIGSSGLQPLFQSSASLVKSVIPKQWSLQAISLPHDMNPARATIRWLEKQLPLMPRVVLPHASTIAVQNCLLWRMEVTTTHENTDGMAMVPHKLALPQSIHATLAQTGNTRHGVIKCKLSVTGKPVK